MKLIEKEIAKKVINAGLSTGATFCEIFVEHTVSNQAAMSNEGLGTCSTNINHGASILILNGTNEVFGREPRYGKIP